MRDFSKPYEGVAFFGVWAEEDSGRYGARDAMAILADAAGQCFEQDVRGRRDVLDALEYLARHATKAAHVERYRRALNEPEPDIRFRAVGNAYNALRRSLYKGP